MLPGSAASESKINLHISQHLEDINVTSYGGTPSMFSHASNMGNNDKETQKQVAVMMRQKDLLEKLQQEKELIRLQMLHNERVMQSRMSHLADEKMAIERKVNNACITIQKFFRMFFQRKAYLKMKAENEKDPKEKLQEMLAQMQSAVQERKIRSLGIDESASRIQRAARAMIARIRFRNSLYKLIIFRNIVETKMHKEKMAMLFGFEQLIINTEEQQEQELAEEERTKFIDDEVGEAAIEEDEMKS